MACLTILTGENSGTRYALRTDRPMTIGRGGFCDLVLLQGAISREHARIYYEAGEFHIEDLSSVNGTFVEGRQLDRTSRLHDGDRINIAGVSLQFHVRSAAELQPSVPSSLVDTEPDLALLPHPPLSAGNDQRLRILLEIMRQLGSTLDVDEILPAVLDHLFALLLNAVNGQILLLDLDGTLAPRALKFGRDGDSADLTMRPFSGEMARSVIASGDAVLQNDERPDAGSIYEEGWRSQMCVPMIGPSRRPVGVIQLEASDINQPFQNGDLELVRSIATIAAQAVEYAQEHDQRLKLDRRKRQMETAREIQRSMLPRYRPELPHYRFCDYYQPADLVGGDFYSYTRLPDGRIAISIADVCGKGLPAALLMAELASEVRHALETMPTVKSVMAQLNDHFSNRGASFITFMLCLIDAREHVLTITNAGHLTPWCKRGRDQIVEMLPNDKGGLPLGVQPAEVYHPVSFPIEAGDVFILSTDGVTEAYRTGKELYGKDKLQRAMASGHGPADQVLRNIVADLNTFRGTQPQTDDICLIAFGREAEPAAEVSDSVHS